MITTLALVGGCTLPRAEPEIHLIPKGYVGWVPCNVEYDQYFVGTRAQLLSAVARGRERDEAMTQFFAANYRC